MGIDRILQLKLVADVADLNSKMGQVDGQVGRLSGAVGKLKGFIGPMVADAVLTGISEVGDRLMGGVEAAREAERIGAQLATTWDRLGLEGSELDAVAASIGKRSLALGFDDDASLQAFDKFLTITKDVDEAQRMLAVGMDIARKQGIPLEQAMQKVIGVYNGSARATREFGFEGKKGMDAVAAAAESVAGAADTHMTTAEGRMERFNGRIDEIFEAVGGIILGLTEPFLQLMDTLDPILADLQSSIGPAFEELQAAAGPVIETLATNLGKLFDVVVKLWPVIQEGIALVSPLIEGFGALVGGVFSGITDLLDAVIALLDGDFQTAWDSAVKFVEKVWGGIVGAIKSPLNMVLGAIEGGLNFLGDAFFGAIEEIRSHLNNVAFIGDHIPDDPISWGGISVPRLAEGGIVTGPTLALIGEAGREAVVPLDRGGMGDTYNITINMGLVTDPAAAGRAIVDAIRAHERRAGAAWRAA